MLGARVRFLGTVLGELAEQEVRQRLDRLAGKQYEFAESGPSRAARVRASLESLGPFYIKIGQLLSTRPDLVPADVAEELERLHDRTEPLPFARMEPVLRAELGSDWAAEFKEFDAVEPLGSASIAQVYRARLTGGREVVVKVQRPGIKGTVDDDMRIARFAARVFARRAPLLDDSLGVESLLGAVLDAMSTELDFTAEARTMELARKAATGYERIRVPDVVLATPRVLIQSLAPGTSIRDADPDAFDDDERSAIGRELFDFMCKGYFLDRVFHADPHPGNIFVQPGGPVTIIDWGMAGRVDRRLSMSLLLVMIGLAQNDSHVVAQSWSEMCRGTQHADIAAFRQDMALLVPQVFFSSLNQLDFGAKLTKVLLLSSRRGIQVNPLVSIVGRSFANLEGSVRHLAPDLSVVETFTECMPGLVAGCARELASSTEIARLAMSLVAGSGLALSDARSVLGRLADGELTVQVDQVQRRVSLFGERADARVRKVLHTALAATALRCWLRSRR
ncbi:ABC1 kinase family protein [Streptomyces ziwulingensis]|uniref:AarF/UbiB family protein n=1 Tax=Streptomyces ziwulingensis TaxID=1045501 RepID=A0ABP9CW90_9ACTN